MGSAIAIATGVQPALIGTRGSAARWSAAADLALASQLVVTPAVRLDALRSEPTPMTGGADGARADRAALGRRP